MITFISNFICKHYAVFGFKDLGSNSEKIFIVSENRNEIGNVIDSLTDAKADGKYLVGYNLFNSIYQELLDDRILVTSMSNSEVVDYLNNYRKYNSSKSENKYIDLAKINGKDEHIDYAKYLSGSDSVFRECDGETETHVRDSAQRIKEDLAFLGELYEKSRGLLNTRFVISKDYNFDCMNWSDVQIGNEILLSAYSQKVGLASELVRRSLPPNETSIDFAKLILPIVSFSEKPFREVLSFYKGTIYNGSFNGKETEMGDGKFNFGLGGLHQCNKGLYESNDEYAIVDFDATAYLPNLISNNGIFPSHLNSAFCDVYKNHIIKTREEEEAKEAPNQEVIKVYKRAASSIFGLTGSRDNWLSSKSFMYRVTINSQFIIAMFLESLYKATKCSFIQTNTDGGTVFIKRSELGGFRKAYNEWREVSGMSLKVSMVKKMAIQNNSSYIMEMEDGSVVSKGNLSLSAHPLAINNAVYSHLFKDKNCQEYIRELDSIKDFFYLIKETDSTKIGYAYKGEVTELVGAARYYISTKEGVSLGRISNSKFVPTMASNSNQVIVDVIPNFYLSEYNLDKMHYTAKALAAVADIIGGVNNQGSLF